MKPRWPCASDHPAISPACHGGGKVSDDSQPMQVPGFNNRHERMARNGTTFGVKVGDSPRWYICPAPPVADALYYAGFSSEDAALDMGDSAVLELIGLGGSCRSRVSSGGSFSRRVNVRCCTRHRRYETDMCSGKQPIQIANHFYAEIRSFKWMYEKWCERRGFTITHELSCLRGRADRGWCCDGAT